MKNIIKIFVVVAMLVFVSQVSFAGPVSEAQKRINDEKHATLVEKSKQLLERKEKIEKELQVIKENLSKLDSGEEVSFELPKECFYVVSSGMAPFTVR